MEKKNVLNTELQICCTSPMTGFYRDGLCQMNPDDIGTHVICAEMTEEFLTFSKGRGNDLTTANPECGFPGLKPGDRWCLCALRWKEALESDKAPPVVLESTHQYALEYVTMAELRSHAINKKL